MIIQHSKSTHKRVPGTSRYEWVTPEGGILQYRNVHLRPFVWELLADLARAQGISGSNVIEQLVTNAAGYRQADKRQD